MRWSMLLGAAGTAALGLRVARSRHRRFLHPAGRSFDGELSVWGTPGDTGAELLDRPARHPVTVRISKGGGTPAGWPDVLGVAVRVHGPAGARHDLLWSTAGQGPVSRHLPSPRRGFDTFYGSILSYRTGGTARRKLYLAVVADPDGVPLGDSLDTVAAAAAGGRARLLLAVADGGALQPLGRIGLGGELPADVDAELAFDPVRNTTDDLHPTGLIHASRALAYRLSQRWRGAAPAAPDGAAVNRTAAHR